MSLRTGIFDRKRPHETDDGSFLHQLLVAGIGPSPVEKGLAAIRNGGGFGITDQPFEVLLVGNGIVVSDDAPDFFNRMMAKPFKWTYQGKVLTA